MDSTTSIRSPERVTVLIQRDDLEMSDRQFAGIESKSRRDLKQPDRLQVLVEWVVVSALLRECFVKVNVRGLADSIAQRM